MNKELYCHETITFYDDWYARGYMDEWPDDKKNRIFDIIRALNLPERGDILDYGCGNGIFTGVLKQVLPKWNVYGVDISAIAVSNARKRYSDCIFFLSSELRLEDRKFDFLFSHHVLEHVDDVNQTWRDIGNYLKEHSSTLHVLPCGNPGSFEYHLCMQRGDGFDRNSENRFVFEDKSHLRRLTTEQMNAFATRYNFKLALDYYSNQFYGALDWITLSSFLFILYMINPKKAKDKISAFKLTCLGVLLVLIKFLRFPANIIDYKKNKMKNYKYYFLFFMLLIAYPISELTNIFLKYLSCSEWKHQKNAKNGSEMYLYYTR